MSKRILPFATAALVSLGLATCGGTAPGGSDSAAAASEAATPGPVASRSAVALSTPSPSPIPAACPPATGAEPDACQIVLGTANIFGAGHDRPPAPGGGGAGTPPTMWSIPAGMTKMTVTGATGIVKPIAMFPDDNGASGDLAGPTDVESYGGISGIVQNNNGMFLVGVFVTDVPPAGEGPERLNFSGQMDFEELAPLVGQTFFIGDGAGRRYIVPSGASRLFLGFADAYLYIGPPGWYDNNRGQLAVSVAFAAD
jgi:hypothetical protein